MTSPTEICAPCPFCGLQGKIYHPGKGVRVRCNNNDCDIQPESWAWTESEALSQWNKRALCLPAEKLAELEKRWRGVSNPFPKDSKWWGEGEKFAAAHHDCADELRDVMGRENESSN